MRPPSAMILAVREAFGDRPLVGAEIGVYVGHNAEFILETLNIQKLYLIDPFDPNNDFEGYIKTRLAKAKAPALERLEPFKDKIQWLFMTSDDAVSHIGEHLDFVYIDGNHSYIYVKRDIENYSCLVRVDGFVGGHDYMMRSRPPIEAKRAVDEFIKESGCELFFSREFDPHHPDWWFRKNGTSCKLCS